LLAAVGEGAEGVAGEEEGVGTEDAGLGGHRGVLLFGGQAEEGEAVVALADEIDGLFDGDGTLGLEAGDVLGGLLDGAGGGDGLADGADHQRQEGGGGEGSPGFIAHIRVSSYLDDGKGNLFSFFFEISSARRALPIRMRLLIVFGAAALWAGSLGGRAEYIGGTSSVFQEKAGGRIITTDVTSLRFETKAKTVEIPYERIVSIEYGQKVDRRYISAVLVNPLFLLAKSRKHFLTVGYTDGEGRSQALIFRVEKADVRGVLVSLEARTGRKITFQDDEARKAGKG
jgi:hypothetical protein